MPSLNDSRKVVTTDIPSIPGSEVEMWDELTVGDAEQVEKVEGKMKQGIKTAELLIKSWNLEEPPTPENVRKLSVKDFEHLLGATKLGKDALKSVEDRQEEDRQKKTA